jgi:biopolymer transport protein ExbD
MNEARRKAREPQREIALQVVPLIDIMFLLLLFFMLGADMSQREASVLTLPRADVPPDPPSTAIRRLVANIRHDSAPANCFLHEQGGECRDARHWKRSMLGVDYSAAELEHTLAGAAQDAGATPETLALLVRADEHAPYGVLQQLFEGAARSGVRHIELAAARRP